MPRFECFAFDAITRSLASPIYGPGRTMDNLQKYVNYFFGPQVALLLAPHLQLCRSSAPIRRRPAFDYLKRVGVAKNK